MQPFSNIVTNFLSRMVCSSMVWPVPSATGLHGQKTDTNGSGTANQAMETAESI